MRLAILAATLFPLISLAQGRIGQVKGSILDSLNKTPLASATINVLDAKDSSLVSFARSRDNGTFEISRLNTGDLILMITYTGFEKTTRLFTITAEKPVVDLGEVMMLSNSELAGVTVMASPVQIKGDTVEF
ncbi:MAG TPA: carboxypeptidase regulatory-like domain-containing protein, partial [Phnomibacter sp.]|nr:carboxypeptidase regulatory-like domain-containing protein [Phnomibacter sp.]